MVTIQRRTKKYSPASCKMVTKRDTHSVSSNWSRNVNRTSKASWKACASIALPTCSRTSENMIMLQEGVVVGVSDQCHLGAISCDFPYIIKSYECFTFLFLSPIQ